MSPRSRDYQEISDKVGGSFRLTSLVQKRARELMSDGHGRPKDTDRSFIEIALEEVEQGRIRLCESAESEEEDEGAEADEGL